MKTGQVSLVTKSALARFHKVSRAAVGQHCSKDKPLFDAVVDGRIEIGHPAYHRWAKGRGDKIMGEVKPVDSKGDDGSAGAMLDIMDLKFRDVIERFGREVRFGEWLKIVKLIEDVREKRLKNYATEGSLISRELVSLHLFGLLEELSRRLLADGVRTITRRTYTAAKANVPIEEQENANREIISQNLRKAREQIQKGIRRAK